MEKVKKQEYFLFALYLFYIFLIIFLSIHHENWRDEAQAYLICRDMNLLEIFKNAHYEGHPIFYYFLLYPFIHLGAGPKIVNVFSILFMSVSIYFIFFRSKLNTIQKVSILVSYPVLYEFSVVGRSYSLVFLFLTLIGLLYPKRKDYPIFFAVLLGLLLNTHLLMAGFVGIHTILFYCYELFNRCNNDKKTNKKILFGFIVLLSFSFLLFLQFYPILLPNDGLKMNSNFTFLGILNTLFSILFGFCCNMNFLLILLSIVVIFLVFSILFKVDRKVFIILIISDLFMAFLLTYIFNSFSIYNLALAYSIFFSCLLMLDSTIFSYPFLTKCLVVMALLSIPTIFQAYKFDISSNYSNSVETARFISDNIDSDAVIVCNNDFMCSSLIPYVSNSFYHTNSEAFFTYVVWKQKRDVVPDYHNIEKFIDGQENVYYIYTGYNKEDISILTHLKNDYQLDLIYESTNKSYSEEDYQIYKINKE